MSLALVATESVARQPAAVYVARLGPGSRRAMATALETLASLASGGRERAGTFAWSRVDYAVAQAIRTALGSRYAPATANRHLAALRGVMREAWRLGQIDGEHYRRATDLAPFRGQTLPKGRALPAAELAALFATVAADRTSRGRRDYALLALLWCAGLRRAEVVELDVADCAGCELRVMGKGRKERLVPLPDRAARVLGVWVDGSRVDGVAAVFRPINRDGVILPTRLSTRAIAQILGRRARQAGIASCAPHDLRRTYVSELLDRGADIATVAALAGHSDVRTTSRYDRRGQAAKRQAAALVDVP